MLKKEFMIKDEGGKEIIMEVGLAVIGVSLLIVYKSAITELTQTLINEATMQIRSLFH